MIWVSEKGLGIVRVSLRVVRLKPSKSAEGSIGSVFFIYKEEEEEEYR